MVRTGLRWITLNLLAAGLVLLHTALFTTFCGRLLEPLLVDGWFLLRGEREAPDKVVIVAIDAESYRAFNLSFIEPWPRSLHISLLEKLRKYQVATVAFDLVFESRQSDADLELMFAEAIRQQPTILASYTKYFGSAKQQDLILSHQPQEVLAAAAILVAEIWTPLDPFNVVRRFARRNLTDAQEVKSLAVAATTHLKPDLELPTDRDYLNYYGPAGSVTSISYHQVLEGNQDFSELFRDAIVFIGYKLDVETPGAVSDSFTTPYHGRPTFGVEIHATAALNILNQDWIRRLNAPLELLCLNLLLFLLALVILISGPNRGFIILVTSIFSWGFVSYHAFLSNIYLPGIIAFLIILPCTFLFAALSNYQIAARRARRLKEVCSRYLTPAMADQAYKTYSELLQTEKVIDGTILFTDIVGYTAVAQKLSATQTKLMLNHYFNAAVSCVVEQGGTPLRFLGDGMMAIWDCSLKETACDNALTCTREIPRRVSALIDSGAIPQLSTRLALHRGEVSIGDLGSSHHTEYTIIGDAVNTAARMEQANKFFGTSLLVSATVKESLRAYCPFFWLGTFQLAGKQEATALYTVYDSEINSSCQQIWLNALKAFTARNWQLAAELFTRALEMEPLLRPPVALYLAQIGEFKEQTPPASWSGEVILAKKSI